MALILFVLPMLGGVANSYFFNPSAARMLVLLVESKLALPCCVAFVFFVLLMFGCVANSDFTMLVLLMCWHKSILMLSGVRLFRPSQFVQPLHGQDARFAHGLLLLMLGGVAILKD